MNPGNLTPEAAFLHGNYNSSKMLFAGAKCLHLRIELGIFLSEAK